MPNIIAPALPFDPTGLLATNLVTNEQQILTAANGINQHFIVPIAGPYFAESLIVTLKNNLGVVTRLVPGVDYLNTHWFISASRACAKQVYGSISFLNIAQAGILDLQYQSVGGPWTIDSTAVATILADTIHNPRITAWEQVTNYPATFPVINHQWDLANLVGASDLVNGLAAVNDTIRLKQVTGLAVHLADTNNPHQVTAAQTNAYTTDQINMLLTNLVGTFSVENQAIITAVQNAIAALGTLTGGGTTIVTNTVTLTNSYLPEVDEAYFLGMK